jgi:hypothetical protein
MSLFNPDSSSQETISDFVLPAYYQVNLDGLTEEERLAAVTAIEEMMRPLRGSSLDEHRSTEKSTYDE